MRQYYNFEIMTGLSTFRAFLSCSEDGKTVDLWPSDDESGRQRWVLTPFAQQESVQTYFITVFGGVDGDASYLVWDENGAVSVQQQFGNGGHLLWTIDFVEAEGSSDNDYHIRPYPRPDLYLSCKEDGILVDLWHSDDGSGRQRWQFQGPFLAD